MMVTDILNILSALAAVAAAILWFRSATITVAANMELDEHGFSGSVIGDGSGNDAIKTALEQSRWSKKAAIAAGMAALLQAGVALMSVFFPALQTCCPAVGS